MTKHRDVKTTVKENVSLLVAALGVFIVGLTATLMSAETARTLLFIAGIVLLALGGFKVYQYFARKAARAVAGWGLATGAGLILFGLVMTFSGERLIDFLPLLFGALMLAGGVIKFQISFDLKQMGWQPWFYVLIAAGVSILFGWIAAYRPFGGENQSIVVSGVFLMVEAVSDGVSLFLFREKKKGVAGGK